DGLPWRVAVEVPDASGAHALAVPLRDQSIATSGDYRRYIEQAGRRYAHTLAPRTGKPLDNDLASVTVIHPECMLADGLATALGVLGAAAGADYAARHAHRYSNSQASTRPAAASRRGWGGSGIKGGPAA
ncbi:FAD:protein FMN transferase, partial [Bordetella pertussis]